VTRSVPGWAVVFASLVALFGVTALAEAATDNPRLLPGLIALGAFAVPVSFVGLVHGLLPSAGIPVRALGTCFVFGGVIGIAAASLLEYEALCDLGVLPALLVGAVEEPAKLVVPLIAFCVGARRHTADGLLLGVAAGMGFAAFETMGYALDALAGPDGTVGASEEVLLLRGALAPTGHPAWTGLVCAALWWTRAHRDRSPAALLVAPAALMTAVLLHGAWDGIDAPATDTAISVTSTLLLLIWVVIARREQRAGAPAELPGSDARRALAA
jgi:RsiW-degrading membrane proteinase PrsW (M82 family)